MDELIEILEDINPDVDYRKCSQLMEEGILTSFDLVTLVVGIKEVFDVTVPAHKITKEYFNSAELIYQLIQELDGEK